MSLEHGRRLLGCHEVFVPDQSAMNERIAVGAVFSCCEFCWVRPGPQQKAEACTVGDGGLGAIGTEEEDHTAERSQKPVSPCVPGGPVLERSCSGRNKAGVLAKHVCVYEFAYLCAAVCLRGCVFACVSVFTHR